MKDIKITGVKRAVGRYREYNGDGYLSPWYGVMMLDRSTGEVWTDSFYSLGHNEWKEYHDPAIITLFSSASPDEVTMRRVKAVALGLCEKYNRKKEKSSKSLDER
jgi:hypothetical protein